MIWTDTKRHRNLADISDMLNVDRQTRYLLCEFIYAEILHKNLKPDVKIKPQLIVRFWMANVKAVILKPFKSN
jgi:hypothetical protein